MIQLVRRLTQWRGRNVLSRVSKRLVCGDWTPWSSSFPLSGKVFGSHSRMRIVMVLSGTSARIRNMMRHLSPASILSLQTIADRSFSMRYELNDDRAKNLTAFLNELVELIKSDDSLPPALKAHIMKLVDEVRRNIDNFEAGIDFDINDSLQRLFGSMYMAESATQEKSKWQTIKDKYLGNMLADFIVQLPDLGLAVSQTLQAIGS